MSGLSKDDDFTEERELKTTSGKAKVTVEGCAGILTGLETNKCSHAVHYKGAMQSLIVNFSTYLFRTENYNSTKLNISIVWSTAVIDRFRKHLKKPNIYNKSVPFQMYMSWPWTRSHVVIYNFFLCVFL